MGGCREIFLTSDVPRVRFAPCLLMLWILAFEVAFVAVSFFLFFAVSKLLFISIYVCVCIFECVYIYITDIITDTTRSANHFW